MDYTIDINGKRFNLNESFRESLEERARRAYKPNGVFSCWWDVQDSDPVLTIETRGKMVPWDRKDQLEMRMNDPDSSKKDSQFGRTHFSMSPHRYEDIPEPGGNNPNRIPSDPDRIDEPMLVMWVPEHPEIDVTWDAGEAIVPMHNWVEWNVQEKADQPRPVKDKENSHDSFESLCKAHGCDLVNEASPSNDIPEEVSGQVKRKGEKSYQDGRYGGENWHV